MSRRPAAGEGVEHDGVLAPEYLHQELDQFRRLRLRENTALAEYVAQLPRAVRIETHDFRGEHRVRRLPFLHFGQIPFGHRLPSRQIQAVILLHLAQCVPGISRMRSRRGGPFRSVGEFVFVRFVIIPRVNRVELVFAASVPVVDRISRRFVGNISDVSILVAGKPRLFLRVGQNVIRVLVEVLAGIADGVHGPAGQNGEEILLAEDLVHRRPQVMELVVVDGDEDRPVLRQQLPEKLQPRPHHAQPFVVPLQILPVHLPVALQPLPHQRAVHLVVVGPALIAGVVGRVDIDAFHPPRVARYQRLQRLQIVAVDNQIAVRALRLHRPLRIRDQRAVGHGQVVRIDMLLALEIQNRHDGPPAGDGAADPTAPPAARQRESQRTRNIRVTRRRSSSFPTASGRSPHRPVAPARGFAAYGKGRARLSASRIACVNRPTAVDGLRNGALPSFRRSRNGTALRRAASSTRRIMSSQSGVFAPRRSARLRHRQEGQGPQARYRHRCRWVGRRGADPSRRHPGPRRRAGLAGFHTLPVSAAAPHFRRWRLCRPETQGVRRRGGGKAGAGMAEAQPAADRGLRGDCRRSPRMALYRKRPNPDSEVGAPEKQQPGPKRTLKRRGRLQGGQAVAGAQVVLNRLQNGALLRTGLGQFRQSLNDASEQVVTPQTARLESGVHPNPVAGLPQRRRLVDRVDRRRRGAAAPDRIASIMRRERAIIGLPGRTCDNG